MRPRSRILLALVLLAFVGAFACLLLHPREPDPLYQGKPLSYWLRGYSPSYAPGIPITPASPTYAEADDAVRHLGTNALPLLLRLLQTPDESLKNRLLLLAHRQHFIRVPYPPTTANVHSSIGGFQSLGRNALPAVPQLIKIFELPPNSLSTRAITFILCSIGPSATNAVPVLAIAAADANSPVRQNCAFALGELHVQPALAVPALIKCLDDTNGVIQATAAHSLAQFGKDAQPAVPALVRLYAREKSNPHGDVAVNATYALRMIDPQAAAQAGIK